MKLATIGLASPAVLALISSVSLAQQTVSGSGTLTIVDRIHGTVAIRQTQSGTVGTNTGAATTMFRLQGPSMDTLHAGDRVNYSATEANGVKTITKIEKQ